MSNSLTKSVTRSIQYIQLDFIRLHRLLVGEGIIKDTKRKMPIAASSTCLSDAEDVAISLFRRFLTTLFAKPDFITEKARGVLEYKIVITDSDKISRFRKGLRCNQAHIADACQAVTTVDTLESGFLHLENFPTNFQVGMDKKADGRRHNRRRWRRNANSLSDACFHESAKAVLSWKSRLDAALLVLGDLDKPNPDGKFKVNRVDDTPPESTDQTRFEQALQNFDRRNA